MKPNGIQPKITKRTQLCVFLVILTFLLTDCRVPSAITPTNSAVAPDKEVLATQTCKLPCWQGIIPGETSKDAFINLIKQNPYFAPDSLEEYPVGSGTVIGWSYPNGLNNGGGVYIRENTIQVLNLDATSGITMGEVIKRFGEPTMVQIDSGLVGDHQAGFDVRAYYPQSGLVVHFARKLFSTDFRAVVQPNLVVDEITLFPPGSAEDIVSIAKRFHGPTRIASIYLLPLQVWHGYGDYEVLRPP